LDVESSGTRLRFSYQRSRNKFKYEPAQKMYKLSQVMPEGMAFPYDFGYIPSTKAADGDPLDVLVLTDETLFPGCLVDCRLIGVREVIMTASTRVR
jgi:inorganic pyrophosphatase